MQAALTALVLLACTADPAGARPRPIDLPARMDRYAPYDGRGRYALAKDDGVRGVQGLFTLAERFGVKPYELLSDNRGGWLPERVIFKDADTGATMLRYTNDRWTDQLSYFQGNWSADGRTIVFRRRPGMWESSTATHGPMAVAADGTGLRNVFREYGQVRGEVCSPTEPGVCYAMADGDRKLVAFDIPNGRAIRVLREVAPGWHLKISPDGKYLMNRAETSKGKGLWIAGVDGREFYEIAVPEAIHDSYCFHPSQKKVMFWYEGKFHDEGFVQCDFDGSHLTKIGVRFDWNHGDMGRDRGVHCEGYVTRVKDNSWLGREELFCKPGVEYYDDPADWNGYASWRPTDQPWLYATRIVHHPYLSELQAFPAAPAADFVVNRFRICYTSLRRGQLLDNPNASPDGTKVLFNSNFLGGNNLFGVVARLPERPSDLKAAAAAAGVRLTWQPGRHHAETAGYHVYRSRTSGWGFLPLTEKPVQETRFTDSGGGQDCFYAVTAVEHSGLESGLSDEARPAGRPAAKRHIYIAMDQARLDAAMWLCFDGSATGLHYIWMRKRDAEGTAAVSLAGGRQTFGSATLWSRVKGREGVEFVVSAGKGQAAIKARPSASWTWVKADKKLDLDGVSELALSSRRYGSAIDGICLTDDDDFLPADRPRIAAPMPPVPAGLKARALSPYIARLEWQAARGSTFHHYNVYCGAAEHFVPDQSTLVASPSAATMVDWGLKPGATYYYRLACVDRFGRESPACGAATVKTPAIRRVLIEKEWAESVAFDAPLRDTYVVWLLLRKAGNSSGYIDVTCCRVAAPEAGKGDRSMFSDRAIRENPAVWPKNGPVPGGGAWSAAPDGLSDSAWLSYDQWGRFDLNAGRHVLKIVNRSGEKLAKVCITNDQSYRPPGHVNILTGW